MKETVVEMKKIIISEKVYGEWYNRGRGGMLERGGGVFDKDLEDEDE